LCRVKPSFLRIARKLKRSALRTLPRRLTPVLLRWERPGAWSPAQDAADGLSETPTPQELARRCLDVLATSLVEFYVPNVVDRRYGGFHDSLRDGQFAARDRKDCVFQARQLWFFSAASSLFPSCLGPATSGYDFVTRHLLDHESGGAFISVNDAGAPVNVRKHAYIQSITIYALVAYHRATGSLAALERACELFRTFDEKAYDSSHGGYKEWFERDWTPIRDPEGPRFLGLGSQKTVNTHLHIVEAFADLYRVWPDSTLRARIEELIGILTTRLDGGPEDSGEVFHRDWSAVDAGPPRDVSYGHRLEAVWLVLDAERAIGGIAERRVEWASRVTDSCLRLGYDARNGGLFNLGEVGRRAHDLRKVGWVQAESMICLLELHRLTGRADYHDRFVETLRFTLRQIVALEGGWYSDVLPDGSRRRDCPRTGPWQAAYHAGRAMLRCMELLELPAM